MFRNAEDRVDRVVERLLRGGRIRASSGDAAERDAVMAAAQLAAARDGHPRMNPAFRRRLAGTLQAGDGGLLTRRTALGAVAGLAAGAVGAAAFGRLPAGTPSRPARTAGALAGGLMQPAGGRWIEVAAMSQLSELQPTRVVAGDLIAFVFRQGQSVHAVSGVCTHMPCNLTWQGGLLCPCHNVRFSPAGTTVNPNYEVPPLPQVLVRVEGDRVLLFSS